MPKKKGSKQKIPTDFTLNDSANAPKAVTRVKKSSPAETENITSEAVLNWEQILDNDLDIIEDTNPDGTKQFVCKKRRNSSKSDEKNNRSGIVYPEIVWYLISRYVKPSDIGRFAGINQTCYEITKRESFWRKLYKRHCENHPKLPEKLCIENSYMQYGLRQRVIRALYHTYNIFIRNHILAYDENRPYRLIGQCCINVWYVKGISTWSVYFKFKKHDAKRRVPIESGSDFIKELGRIDANAEKDMQVMQVLCTSESEIAPLMGMTLLSVTHYSGFHNKRVHLGFTYSRCLSKYLLPDHLLVLEHVVDIMVYDWWHPEFPNFDNSLPSNMKDDESMPVLKEDFFKLKIGDL